MPARVDARRPAGARPPLRERPRLPPRRRRVRGAARARPGPAALKLVEETVAVGRLSLRILRPPDAEALLDEEAFEREELMPYWAELWPSGPALGRALLARAAELPGKRVVELGCGLGIPSLVAALSGARVLATDWSANALAAVVRNARLNGARLETLLARWDEPARLVERGPWELVLASDVLYERPKGAELLRLLPLLVADGGEILLADPGRPATAAFVEAASRDWTVETEREGDSRVTVYRLTA